MDDDCLAVRDRDGGSAVDGDLLPPQRGRGRAGVLAEARQIMPMRPQTSSASFLCATVPPRSQSCFAGRMRTRGVFLQCAARCCSQHSKSRGRGASKSHSNAGCCYCSRESGCSSSSSQSRSAATVSNSHHAYCLVSKASIRACAQRRLFDK